MSRRVSIILLDDARERYEVLSRIAKGQQIKGTTKNEAEQVIRSLNKKKQILQVDPTYGDKIQKEKRPPELVERYGADKAFFRLDLAMYWRAVYYLQGSKDELYCVLVKILTHPEYDTLFGY